MRRKLSLPLLLATALLCGPQLKAQRVRFDRDVLPVLSDRCFPCHGPDAGSREAGLRLDLRANAFEARDGIAAVVPRDRERSELWRRIRSDDPSEVMPPPDAGLQLSEAEIDTLGRWIDRGAPWATHWAFSAPDDPIPPMVENGDWPRNSIDGFVLARLEAEGRAPNRPAPPEALLRRVHLDLTGLPPTPAQLDAFLADPSDAAYARVVDSLLASPRYGERMAWPWLEASRYADTDGYQADPTRTAWPWRDHLVRSLNANQPFDQFTMEALAGDLLPNATQDQVLATGLLRNNAHNGEGGRIAEETRVENVFDRTETVGTAWLGLTLECARCHDHKYDPIPQRDYYRFYAFFDQTSETGRGRSGGNLVPSMRYARPEDREALLEVDTALARIETALSDESPELARAQRAWEAEQSAELRAALEGFAPSVLGDWQQSRRFPPPEGRAEAMFAHAFSPESEGTDADWTEASDLRDGAPLGLPDGQYAVYFRRGIVCATDRRMRISLGSDDAIKVWCNGELLLANDARRGVRPDQESTELPLRKGPNELLVKIVNTGGVGGVYFRRVDETPGQLPVAVTRALLAPTGGELPAQRELLRRWFRRDAVDGARELEAERAKLVARRDALLKRGQTVSVMDHLPPERQRTTRVLGRGDYQSPGETVTPGTPAFLPALDVGEDRKPTRLDLARWLVSGDNPLVARVAVNRAWQTFFGRGLVATPEDFGRQGERPSHPTLLDWLAYEFVASGWNVKALHRRIVLSATYRQAAAADPVAFADDPQNRLLARSPRFRLPAWMLRDQALALSGRLVERLGGAPVRPYQPDGIWAEATFGIIKYRRDEGAALYRRSLYVFWRRIVGPTFLFDTPSRLTCTVRPGGTNTPLHALTTLNETAFVEAARGLAERSYAAGSSATQRIAWLFRAATSRAATPGELAVLRERFTESVEAFASQGSRATELLGVGAAAPSQDIPPTELAALTVVASVVLNLDEVLTRP